MGPPEAIQQLARRKPQLNSSDSASLARFLREYGTHRRFAARGDGIAAFFLAYARARRPRSTPERLKQMLDRFAPLAAESRRRGEEINLWNVAGLGRNELRTASVLAWALSPHGSHGQGDALSRTLWRQLGAAQRFGFEIEGVRHVMTEVCPLGDACDRVDLVLEGPAFVLFLEVKIDAREGPDQIRRYRDAAQRKAAAMGKRHGVVAYLAEHASEVPDDVLHLRWRDVAAAADTVVGTIPNCLAATVLRQFARHVRSLH